MNITSILILSSLIATASFANTVEGKTPAELVELGLHKLERLSSGASPRIEKSFQTQTVEINVVPTNGNTSVSYLQGAAVDGTRKTATINLMNDGMIMGSSSNQASAPATALQLPDLNAIGILEFSLHCVEGENIGGTQLCSDTTALREFAAKMSKAALAPVRDATGAIVGVAVEIFGEGLTQKAIISFATDGSLAAQNPIQFVNL